MDMMEIRRTMMGVIAMASGGGNFPSNFVFDNVTISATALEHTFSHSMGSVPDMFFLFPKTQPNTADQNKPYFLEGMCNGVLSSGIDDYPNVLRNVFPGTTSWNSQVVNFGWTADSQSIGIKLVNANRLPASDYFLVTFKYDT